MEDRNKPGTLEIRKRGYESKMDIKVVLTKYAGERYVPEIRVAACAALVELRKVELKEKEYDNQSQLCTNPHHDGAVYGCNCPLDGHSYDCRCPDCVRYDPSKENEGTEADEGTEGDESSETDEGTALDHGVYQ